MGGVVVYRWEGWLSIDGRGGGLWMGGVVVYRWEGWWSIDGRGGGLYSRL